MVQDYHGLCLSLGTAELSCVVQRICGENSPSVLSYDDRVVRPGVVSHSIWKLLEMVVTLLNMCCIGHPRPGLYSIRWRLVRHRISPSPT